MNEVAATGALVARENASALPSLTRARDMLASCMSHQEVRNIKVAAQAHASLAKSQEVANQAQQIVCECTQRHAELIAELREARPKGGDRHSKAFKVEERSTLTKPQKDAESRIAPLVAMPRPDRDAYYDACREAKKAPTVEGLVSLARMAPEHRQAVLIKLPAATDVRAAISEAKRDIVRAKLEDVAAVEAKAASGVYDVIVLDPPWAMEKIEREVRPNQVEFDYPTMSEEQLRGIQVPCADDAHVFVWTTHKFLPMALRLLEAWSLKYVCTFVWHKPGGFQPIGLPQYNCEFALYARRGSPKFVDTKALPTCFPAPRGAHSEKPEEFYEVLRRVTGGRRLDMFSRRTINGFDGWGKEATDGSQKG